MQTTLRKDTKTRKEPKEESSKKDEKLQKSLYTISTPRDFIPKSTAADIYAQKKKAVYTNAPKKVAGNSTKNISPMKGLLKSSASSISQISQKSKTDAKSAIYSTRETPRKQPAWTNATVNSPTVKRKLNVDRDLKEERKTDRDNGRRQDLESLRIESKNNVAKAKNKADITKIVPKTTREVDITNNKRKDNARKVAKTKTDVNKVDRKSIDVDTTERQRTSTRTLDENEVKILTSDLVDNNAGMINLAQKLKAKPKSFYVELDEDKQKPIKDKCSDEQDEISYEDDFESYESDFDSYHSDQTETDKTSVTSEKSGMSETSERSHHNEETASAESSLKDGKDEEKMLDSGNFDLRDQRSAKTKPAVMDFILEDGEGRKTLSLTDEGFQDMSSASSSLRTQNILDRPLFIDFTKAKENKLKRKHHDRLRQRAKDLLGMITLHEMSYSLFEMQPISYDVYMATFGRSNYTQSGVQTFDDGITEEIQTEEVPITQKWTQHPVEFSKNDIYVNKHVNTRRHSKSTEDYLTRFTFLMAQIDEKDNVCDDAYKNNPLRIYFEQKDGAGGDEMLPYETYKSKLKANDYNSNKLGKFLKKIESKVSHVLSSNKSSKEETNLSKSNEILFSKGYVSLSIKSISDEKLSFLKFSKITRIIFSETKGSLILTVHKKAPDDRKRSLVCLWDLSVARVEPVKVLTAIDDVIIGRFRGNVDGVFVAALEDGSIHLWDLSEEPTWRDDDASEKKTNELVEFDTEKLTEVERDREWNLRNSHIGLNESHIAISLQSCAYTSSATNMTTKDEVDSIVGLEMNSDVGSTDAGRKVIGQIISLQRIGVLTIWSIIQEKLKSSKDMGKAFLSKMKLEKYQTIRLTEHIDVSSKQLSNGSLTLASFNLNAAKRRLSSRKKEKCIGKNQNGRPQSTMSMLDFDIDRPSSAASMRKRVLPVEINVPKNWETGIVCNDLKILRVDNVESYLVAKNCGEVLRCKRFLGAVKIERFSVATDTSSITKLEVSTQGLPYFIAATDTGTVNLCSLLDNRVLLTLDCSEHVAFENWSITTVLVVLENGQSRVEFKYNRNVPSSEQVINKCVSDHKGRFVSSITSRSPSRSIDRPLTKLEIKSLQWSPVNPCSIHVLLQDETIVLFELTHSDIYAKYVCNNAALQCTANDCHLALLTPDREVHIHRLSNETQTKENLLIFQKYVALL